MTATKETTKGRHLQAWEKAHAALSPQDQEREREMWRDARIRAVELDEKEAKVCRKKSRT